MKLTKLRKTIWFIGNMLIGGFSFYAYLWAMLQAWGQNGNFWLYAVGSIAAVVTVFVIFNLVMIPSEKLKHWGVAILILLGSSGITIAVHAVLQNTILE